MGGAIFPNPKEVALANYFLSGNPNWLNAIPKDTAALPLQYSIVSVATNLGYETGYGGIDPAFVLMAAAIDPSGLGNDDDGYYSWPSPGAGRKTINGIVYSQHALEQMEPIGFGGRGVPPSAVENAIRFGARSPGRTPGTTVFTYENVQVVYNETANVVITVIKTGH